MQGGKKHAMFPKAAAARR